MVCPACIDAQQGLDDELLAAPGRGPSLREETPARMAEAVRAAALGFGPAGCAAAAGAPERLPLNRQVRNPSFAAAMSGARALARSHGCEANGADVRRAPSRCRCCSRRFGRARSIPVAAALAGTPRAALCRLRKERPKVSAPILAARRARSSRTGRRGGYAYEHRLPARPCRRRRREPPRG
ncbi:hypothetical protein [Streptomyces sp. NPDC047706]|uniref:hypothetical protein n=1 Tax=Streptomyces sp. NPDC047706 TaxID=3365486 RepID=UPI0037135E02